MVRLGRLWFVLVSQNFASEEFPEFSNPFSFALAVRGLGCTELFLLAR
jgi:hypothetical protein